MEQIIFSDELLEKLAEAYQKIDVNVTFQQFVEAELQRLLTEVST